MDTAQFFNIQDLTFDPELQVRVRINDEQVAQYAECMATEEDMKTFPPVEIFYDGVKHWLADGHHRRAAAEKAGHTKIWAIIKSGTHEDAVWAAISGNGKQGLAMTADDRKRALEIALRRWPAKSNRVIADAIGCSRDTVRRMRDEISTGANAPVENERRVGRDGKSRPAKQKTQKQASTKESPKQEEPLVESTDETTPDPTEQLSEQASQFRPGSLPTQKYVGETQLKPIPRDRPDILVANLIAFFPEEFVMNTAREVFRMLHNRHGKKVTKPFAQEIYKEYGRGK